jgi:hypothetical protein
MITIKNKDKIIKALGISFAIITGAVGLLDATGCEIQLLYVIIVYAILLTGISVYYIFLKKDKEFFFEDPDIMDITYNFIITYDTKEDCLFLNQSTENIFGEDFVDNDHVELWRLTNPKGFLCLKDSQNNVLAGITMLSFEPKSFKFFKDGIISESELSYDNLNSFEESFDYQDLYIAFIFLNPKLKTRDTLRMLIWGFFEYLKKFYIKNTGEPHRLYALPININSENILVKYNFNIYPNAHRKDKHRLYYLDLTKENFTRIQRLPDYSNICHLNFD